MPHYALIDQRLPCPFLPEVSTVIRPSALKEIKASSDRELYYFSALQCAQSLWLCGLPAQALLQLNMSLAEDLPEDAEVIKKWNLPYKAKQWVIMNREEAFFMGNPVRHYQHLASRMSGKNKEHRTCRAWACFHLAETILPAIEFPRDHEQVMKENLSIPRPAETINSLLVLHKEAEAETLKDLLRLS